MEGTNPVHDGFATGCINEVGSHALLPSHLHLFSKGKAGWVFWEEQLLC